MPSLYTAAFILCPFDTASCLSHSSSATGQLQAVTGTSFQNPLSGWRPVRLCESVSPTRQFLGLSCPLRRAFACAKLKPQPRRLPLYPAAWQSVIISDTVECLVAISFRSFLLSSQQTKEVTSSLPHPTPPSSPLKLEVRPQTLHVSTPLQAGSVTVGLSVELFPEKKKKIGWAISFVTRILNVIAHVVKKVFCKFCS